MVSDRTYRKPCTRLAGVFPNHRDVATLRLCPLEPAVRRRWAFPLFHRSTAGHSNHQALEDCGGDSCCVRGISRRDRRQS